MSRAESAAPHRPRVIWLTTEATPRPRTGGSIRSLRLVQALARVADVHVVNLGAGALDAAAYRDVSGVASVRSMTPRPRPAALRLAQALLSGAPMTLGRMWQPALAELVRAEAAAGSGLVVEHTLPLAHRPRGMRTVVALQNVDSEWLVARAEGRTLLRRGLDARERSALRRQERRLVSDPDVLLVAVSDDDARTLGGAQVVANGADLPDLPGPVPSAGPLLFVGSLGYAPNEDAVRWWVREVHPLGGLPPLTVVGRGAAAALADLAHHPAVEVVGEVDDVGPWYRRARAVAIPLRAGAGTRLKVPEALGAARPVVSTRKGMEGFDVRDGEQLLVADSAAEFAAAVRRLMADDDLARQLADAGRQWARGYSWDALAPRFAELVVAHVTAGSMGVARRAQAGEGAG